MLAWYDSDCHVVSFRSLYFLKAFQNSKQFMFLGINVFCALLRAHFNPCLVAQAKMGMSRAQNIFMPANINPTVSSLFSEINS